MKQPAQKRIALFFIVCFLSAAASASAMSWRGWHYYFVNFDNYSNGEVVGAKDVPVFSLDDLPRRTDAMRFLAFGCYGTGNGGQKLTSNEMAQFTADRGFDFAILLGDNFYPWGVKSIKDPQWQEKFEQMYPVEKFPGTFYAVLGNHDYYHNPQAQIDYTGPETRWYMPSHYYKFTKVLASGTQADFFGLDATLFEKALKKDEKFWQHLDAEDGNKDVQEARLQLRWLKEQLSVSQAKWKIVFSHEPLFSGDIKRGDDVVKFREFMLPVLTENGVDLYLSAHAHTLEIMKPVGSLHIVVSGAASRPRKKVFWTEQTLFASADLSYTWIQLSESNIDIAVMGEGQKLDYLYQIKKN